MNAKFIWMVAALGLGSAAVAPAALQRVNGPTDQIRPVSASDLATQLTKARAELAQLLTKYSEQHPKVVAQAQKIALLEQLLAAKHDEEKAQQRARESATT